MTLPANMKAVRLSQDGDGDCPISVLDGIYRVACVNLAYPYSVEGASGYVIACSKHADHVFEQAILDGLITFKEI